MSETIEVRRCISCEKWKLKEHTKEVATSSNYIPTYSATAGHMNYKYERMCMDCIKKLPTNNTEE